ncbi:MAG: TolA [Methylocystaceae bacterium]|nr:MAG: TolA [Methylocystaceae bacterium]
MKISRSEPGFPLSSAIHAGLLLAAFVLFSDARKFDDAVETVPVDLVTDSELTQIMKGEKTAREIKPTPRVDKVAPEAETKPEPPLAQAKKDIATPPPPVRPLPQPTADDAPPTPPKRVAALPPKPEPPPKPVEKQPEPKPVAKPKAAPPEPDKKEPEKKEPEEAEVVKPKPPARTKPDHTAKDAAATEKPKERLKIDEVAKLLDSKKPQDKPEPETSIGELAPKSGEENAPKSKFDAASISKLLSHEAPQRKAATGRATQAAALGAPTGAAATMSASMEARIAAYIHDHYYPCWASGLSLGGQSYTPIVEFHLSRDGELEGRPKLLNASASPTEHARGEQAMQAVRRCSPMRIPPEFLPYYEEALHDVTIRFQDAN